MHLKMYRSCCEQSDGIADENAKLSGELANASKIISDLTNQMHFINAVQKATRKTDEAGFEAMSESLQQSLADILGLKFKDNN